MEDQVASGLFILDGSARVRTAAIGLVRLDQIATGAQGPQGPPGPAGADGTVDTANY